MPHDALCSVWLFTSLHDVPHKHDEMLSVTRGTTPHIVNSVSNRQLSSLEQILLP